MRWQLRLLAASRVLGVDVARAVALFGMMATHIFEPTDVAGVPSAWHVVFSGRASALFCVLAGLSLTISTRRSGQVIPGAWRGVLARAVLLILLGLALPDYTDGVAIILVYYGVLFFVGAALLRARTAWLWSLAGVWAVAGPVVSFWWRSSHPGSEVFDQVTYAMLARDPVQVVQLVFLDGYYPVLTWVPYLVLGMALGRLSLGSGKVALRVGGVGLIAAVVTFLGSKIAVATAGLAALEASHPAGKMGPEISETIQLGVYGTTPVWSAWWLVTTTPHSGSVVEVLHNGASAALVIGCCVAAGVLLPQARYVWFLFAAAGSMTLTLYVAHVLLVESGGYWAHVFGAVTFACLWSFTPLRGPLETVMHYAAKAARWRSS